MTNKSEEKRPSKRGRDENKPYVTPKRLTTKAFRDFEDLRKLQSDLNKGINQ